MCEATSFHFSCQLLVHLNFLTLQGLFYSAILYSIHFLIYSVLFYYILKHSLDCLIRIFNADSGWKLTWVRRQRMKTRTRKLEREQLLVILMALLFIRDDNCFLCLSAHIYVLSGAICTVTEEEQDAGVYRSHYTQWSAQAKTNTCWELLRTALSHHLSGSGRFFSSSPFCGISKTSKHHNKQSQHVGIDLWTRSRGRGKTVIHPLYSCHCERTLL